jgi:hypothetical protein
LQDLCSSWQFSSWFSWNSKSDAVAWGLTRSWWLRTPPGTPIPNPVCPLCLSTFLLVFVFRGARVQSAKCKVQSAKCKVQSAKCNRREPGRPP